MEAAAKSGRTRQVIEQDPGQVVQSAAGGAGIEPQRREWLNTLVVSLPLTAQSAGDH